MTALEQYQRLECTGLWRDEPDGQRREVIVSLGDASLVITDKLGNPISHWSLPAVIREDPRSFPANFRPSSDSEEQLELEDTVMIEGIETVRIAIDRRRARPGRLRGGILLIVILIVASLAFFWLPGAMQRYTASIVPDSKRAAIGSSILDHIHRITGGECVDPAGTASLATLASRLNLKSDARIAVLADGARITAHLPGGLILANRSLVEDHETPDVLAGFVVLERFRAAQQDTLLVLLEEAGLRATFRLLTTGDLPRETLNAYGEHLLTGKPTPVDTGDIISAFSQTRVPVAPYAYAVDPTGETTVDIIEADPFAAGGAPQTLTDAHWVALQGICGA